MKKLLLLITTTLISSFSFSQDRYTFLLTDKNNSPYTISNPSAYLSTRALARRTQAGIAIDYFDLPVTPQYVNTIAGLGATVLSTSKWNNSVTVDLAGNTALLAQIQALPFVQSTTHVGKVVNTTHHINKFASEKIDLHVQPISPNRTASNFYDYGNALNQVQMLHGDALHNMGHRGNGMIIAILDAGAFNANNMNAFDSLRANNRILYTYDYVANDSNIYDDDAHGSYTLSLIGGYLPGTMVGTAPEASFILLESEDAPHENLIEEFNWATAAENADSAGADVISSSLGYSEFDDATMNHTYQDMDGQTTPISKAATMAARKGMVVVSSAGNSGNSPWHYITAPADADSIITAGAVDDLGMYAGFSSTGPTSDGRVKPTVAAQGQGTYVADVFNGGAFPGNGTSFSCPLLAGMAACLWQCNPTATNIQLIEAIKQSASQYSTPDSLLGYGIPNFETACSILASINNPNVGKGEFLDNVFPNPFDNNGFSFNFYSDTNQDFSYQVYDITGKIIFESNGKLYPHKMTSVHVPVIVSRGIYFLRVVTEHSIYKSKLMMQE
jgi:serine protease AprX